MERVPLIREKETPSVEAPEYWKDNPPFKSPKKYFELQYEFAKIMAERTCITLTEAVRDYAPILRRATHLADEEGTEHEPIEGLTEENMFEAGYAMAQKRRARAAAEGEHIPYHDEKESRFGCHSYDYDPATQTIHVHFFNAEAEEEWEDGKDVSKGPLSEEKIDRRMHELKEMFQDIKAKHPDVKYVHGRSNLYNLASYRRLYPPTYEVGEIDYDPKRWSQGMSIWGQFLGGNDKVPGEYGFKEEDAKAFLEKVKEMPLERLADALPNPPRFAEGDIQDFYDFYGIE